MKPMPKNKTRNWFAMQALGNRHAQIAIDGPIGWYGVSARDFRDALDELGDVDEIEVVVNSPGGSVGDGVAIFAMLRKHKARIIISIEGYALSMGSVISMAGDVVRIGSASIMMVHKPWSVAMGNATEMRKEADVLDVHEKSLMNAYTRRSGITAEAATEHMDAETWMDSGKALELGYVDEIFDAPESDDDDDDDDASAFARGMSSDEMDDFLARLGGNAPEWARGQITSFTAARAARVIPNGNREKPMPKEVKKDDSAAAGASNDTANTPASDDAQAKARANGVASERARVAGIRDAFATAKLPDNFISARDKAEADGSTVAEFGKVVEALTSCVDSTPAAADATAYAGEDSRDKFRKGAADALSALAGIGKHDPQNEYNSMSLSEICRQSLIAGNQRAVGNRMEIVGMAFTHSSSDFPHILHDIAHRSLLASYDEVEETFTDWTSTGNFRDFRSHERVGWNSFNNLELIGEGGEYKRDSFSDYKESAKIDTHGKMFSITRQAIINDDIGAFTQIPAMFGQAAKRTVGANVFNVLVANGKMGDGVAMLHATHGNLNTTAAAISTDSVSKIRRAMALNKGRRTEEDAQPSGIRPNILLCPLALEDRAMVLAASEHHIGSGALSENDANTPNSVRNSFTVIADPRLDAISSTDWYMVAGNRPPIEVGYLDGNQTPYLEAKNGWGIDGVEWKVRLDAGVNPVEYMTIYKQVGA